jgi:hypothetical protein
LALFLNFILKHPVPELYIKDFLDNELSTELKKERMSGVLLRISEGAISFSMMTRIL